MTPPPPRNRSPDVRCRLCGRVFPGWLPVPDEPHAALLLHHLAALHPVDLKPLLARMATEDILDEYDPDVGYDPETFP